MVKSWSSVPNTLGLVVNLKKVMAKLRKQVKTAGPMLDTQTNLGAFTDSDRPSEVDRLRLRLDREDAYETGHWGT